MTTSFCTGLTSDNRRILIKTKVSAAVIVLFVLLVPRIWAETRKEHINLDGRTVAVEASTVVCGQYTMFPTFREVGKIGGERNVTVYGADGNGCATASSDAPWLTITGGNGTGNIIYTVDPNNGPSRTGNITIANQNPVVKHTVTQESGCTQSFSPSSKTVDFVGGTLTVTVGSGPGCAWTAEDVPSWITINGGGGGTGDGTVSYTVDANPGEQRTGTITIGTSTFTVTQGANCQLECDPLYAQCLDPNLSQSSCLYQCGQYWSFDCSGGPYNPECVAGYESCILACGDIPDYCGLHQQCQTSCNNACDYKLRVNGVESSGTGFANGGGSGAINISSAACSWTAVSNVPISNRWLQVTSGASGVGAGTVGYSVSANVGPARTGTLTIAQKTFTVTQSDGCTYNLSLPSANPEAGGGVYSVNVTGSDAGCQPAITNVPAWTTNVTVNGSGTVKTVNYTVLSNTGPVRATTMTIGGKPFTVEQKNGCTYNISPANANFTPGGGTGSIAGVTSSNASCPWTAVSSEPSWMPIVSGASGTGNGNVSYNVFNYNGFSARTGTLTIAGKTFTVTQAGCSQSLSPSSNVVGFVGGTGTITVNSNGPSCAWTTGNVPSWITINGSGGGTGGGTVSYTFNPNPGGYRTGTITIGTSTFTVMQAANCQLECASTAEQCSNSGQSCAEECMAATGCYIPIGGCIDAVGSCVSGCLAETQNACVSQVQQCEASCYNTCGYTISSTSASVPLNGTSGTVNVNSAACTWTARSNVAWITVTGGGSGTGAGTVSYTVASNTGVARTGTMTIAGKTFTVTQDGCTYSLNPTGSGTINKSGGSGSFTINTSGTCTWTVSKDSWITITGGNGGTGTGTVSYSVGSNSGSPRNGTITAGGKPFTVTQDGVPCNQYCSLQVQICSGGCTGQCLAQLPQECNIYPQVCAPFYQACTEQCPSQCSSVYASCMASCL